LTPRFHLLPDYLVLDFSNRFEFQRLMQEKNKKMKATNMLPAEESDHELVVNVLANLYDTAKCSIPPVSPKKILESHAIRSPTPSSGSDSSMEDISKSQRKKRPLSQTLTEEEKLEEERKEKRREKDRIRKRIQREKQRKEKQLQLQAKNNAIRNDKVNANTEQLVMPSLQSFFSAYIAPSAEGDSYGILFPLPKPPSMNLPEPPAVDTRQLKLPQFAPFFVNTRVMS